MGTFKAIRIDKAEKGTTAALTQFDEAELMDGDVTVAVEWSTLNYKDGLAVTGKAAVVRRFPMIAGIDFAGTVAQSSHPAWKAGDKVVCNGWGMGVTQLGAYAEKARVIFERTKKTSRIGPEKPALRFSTEQTVPQRVACPGRSTFRCTFSGSARARKGVRPMTMSATGLLTTNWKTAKSAVIAREP